MFRKISLLVVMVVVLVGVTGCIQIKKQTATTSNLGGVFVSSDRAETWTHHSLLMTPGETAGSIGAVDTYFLNVDPSDNNALYLGTFANGLYYSWNAGAGWNKVEKLGDGMIRDLVVDSKDKCQMYVAKESKIFKSEDCTRTWKEIWYSDNAEKIVSALALDWFDSKIVYAGLSDGSLLKSSDYGRSWTALKNFGSRIRELIVDPFDSRILYVGTMDKGLFRTVDKGESFDSLLEGMKDYRGANVYSGLQVSPKSKGLLIYASQYGLLRSLDGGTTWAKIGLTSGAGEKIYALALDPSNTNILYYSTDQAFYKSLDGGSNWSVKRMPSTRIARDLFIYPTDPKRVYMGVYLPTE